MSTSFQTIPSNYQSRPQTSVSNVLTSTTLANPLQTQQTVPLNMSSFSIPNYNHTLPSHMTPTHNTTSMSNTSGISLDSTKLFPYDGKLVPVHPEEFLEQAEQYFLTQPPVPDQLKINYIKERFIGDARLWYNTLLPSPSVYQDFLLLFRSHFWSNNQQRAIRNELYRPCFHRDNTSLQKHAMDWINKARFLRPPIDQAEMVDQIISHFTFNISVALRGLRITTTNELIQQLSHLQQSHSSSNNSNPQPTQDSFQQNSYSNSGSQNQNRYPPRNSNYSRPQYNNSNNTQPSPPDHTVSPPGKLTLTRPVRMCPVSLNHTPQINILTHPLDLHQEIIPPPNYRPEISLQLFNNVYNALLDSGASVSAISEELFQNLTSDPSQQLSITNLSK